MPKLTNHRKPFKRRMGSRVVRIDERGVAWKSYRRRKWRFATWEQIASLADDSVPLLAYIEQCDGADRLAAIDHHVAEAKG